MASRANWSSQPFEQRSERPPLPSLHSNLAASERFDACGVAKESECPRALDACENISEGQCEHREQKNKPRDRRDSDQRLR
jgi:hypothetical protein